MSVLHHPRSNRRPKPPLREVLHSIGAVLYLIAGFALGIYGLGWACGQFIQFIHP